MNELFEIEGRSIFAFKKGDLIIRLKSVQIKQQAYNDNLGIATETIKREDASFRSRPVELIGIYNNLIYLKDITSPYIHRALLEHFSDDWGLFVIPDGLKLQDCL